MNSMEHNIDFKRLLKRGVAEVIVEEELVERLKRGDRLRLNLGCAEEAMANLAANRARHFRDNSTRADKASARLSDRNTIAHDDSTAQQAKCRARWRTPSLERRQPGFALLVFLADRERTVWIDQHKIGVRTDH